MPLKLQIKKGQQVIINGAVVENTTQRTISLLVKNEAAILRDRDILTAEDAATPASRIYFSLQCMYLFPSERERFLPLFNDHADSYERAAPSARDIIAAMRGLVAAEQFYGALKKAQELIAHEGKVLAHVQQQISQQVLERSDGGQPGGDGSLGVDAGGPSHEGGSGA